MAKLHRICSSSRNLVLKNHSIIRTLKTHDCKTKKKGLVLGAYKGILPTDITLTPTAQRFDSEVGGKLKTMVLETGLDDGKVQIFSSVHSDYQAVAVAGMSSGNTNHINWIEDTKDYKERIRVAAGVGAMALQNIGISNIEVEAMNDAEAAAEGAALGVWQEIDSNTSQTKLKLYKQGGDRIIKEKWKSGYVKGMAQNLARYLSGTPTNIMTPSKFADHCKYILGPYGIRVKIRDRNYVKKNNMDAFWAITEGSCDIPSFIEMHYRGSDAEERPILLVGKGCTFDFGGMCTHRDGAMSYQHGGMAGAASVVGVFKALCQFRMAINVSAILPLYENIINLSERTSSEKRFISILDDMAVLADVMSYSTTFKPSLIINIAALSLPIDELGTLEASPGNASIPSINPELLKDCLPEDVDFCHIITDTKKSESEKQSFPYLKHYLNTGRPTRLLIQFLQNKARINYSFLE